MTGAVRVIAEDSQFAVELAAAGVKLVVVDFTASWCGPCQRIAPVFEELSQKYERVVFLKVDVDQCPDTAAREGVTAMPTFIFYRNKIKIDRMSGADGTALEAKIVALAGADDAGDADVGVPGHMDLLTFINKSECECLNESDDHTFPNCLTTGNDFLESDCDEQLIMSIAFNQSIKLHSMKVTAPEGDGPKVLKIFSNQPRTLDFDQADSMEPVQLLELQEQDVKEGTVIPLRFVKFQNVHNLQIFVKNNQGGKDTTRIDHLCLIGSPVNTTNMGEFKRVAGKKGESH